MNSTMNVTTEDFPVIGTLIMIVVFVYAWIADTSERKEAFTDNQPPPSKIETFYGGPPLVLPRYQAYSEQSILNYGFVENQKPCQEF